MRKTCLVLVTLVAFLALTGAAVAQIDREKTLFTLGERTAVGSDVLNPGSYRVHVVKLSYNRSLVQITDPEGTHVFAQALTTPHPVAPGETIPESKFVYYPASDRSPRALRTWYPPDALIGQDFVYPKGRAEELAVASKENVVAMPEKTLELDYPVVPLITMTPQKTEEPYVAAVPETFVAEKPPVKLPKTASREPLVALAGLAALGGALALRKLAR
jgi:hypothetical protein